MSDDGTKTVLIADDNRQIRMLVRATLRAREVRVIEAEDGEAALEMAIAEQPHLMLLDIMMPKLDGFEVLHFLRKREDTVDLPVVVLTTAHAPSDLERGVVHRVADYIVKPFAPSDLLRVADRILT